MGLASRVSSGTPEASIRSAYEIALGRAPTANESADAVAYVDADGKDKGLVDFCQALMCLNEFVYVD